METTGPVSVTIGIPTYNRLHYLKQSAASALAQDYPNLEILISQNPHPNPVIREPIERYCQEVGGQRFADPLQAAAERRRAARQL